MTDKTPGDVVGIHDDKIQIHLSRVKNFDPTLSYVSVGIEPVNDGYLVSMQPGKSFVRLGGDVFLLENFERREQSGQEGYQTADVVFIYPDGFPLPDDHELADITLSALADRLESGELELTQAPNIDY